MIETVERVVQRTLELVGGWMFATAMTLVVAVALTAFLGLSLYKFDKESCLAALRRLGHTLRHGWAWALLAVAVLLMVFGLDTLRHGLVQRLADEGKAAYVSSEDQGGGPTVQRAPSISYLETSSRTQKIVIPANAVGTLDNLPGWDPEQARYDTRPALNVEDELVRDGKTVIINRKTTLQRFVAAKLASSTVDVHMRFRDRQLGQRRQFYQAEFNGRYTYVNPFPDPCRFHFNFPLPDNSGTLSGFHFKVNGQELPPGDITQGFVYEADLASKAKTVIEVTYTHLGSQSWSYDVAGRRGPIADFHLQVHVDKGDVKFERGSLYPTSMAETSGEQSMAWDLQNQITSQSVNLYFPSVSAEQLIGNLYIFSPVSLICFVALMLVWSRLRRVALTPWVLLLASLASCAGYAFTSYLVSYLPLWVALGVGFTATAGLQHLAVGRRLWVPVVLMAVAPFTFLVVGHTGLLLSLMGMIAVAATIVETLRTRDLVLAQA